MVKKERITCGLFDKMNYVCRKYSDRMARMGLTYDFIVDEKIFKQVVTDLFNNVHMLRSSIHSNPLRLYWQTEDYNIDDVVDAVHTDNPQRAKEAFFCREIPVSASCQMNFALIYHGDSTDICMLWNHMCMDGSAAKVLLVDICTEYNRRIEGKDYGNSFKTGNRKFYNVYSDMDFKTKLKAKSLFIYKAMSGKCVFPFKQPAVSTDGTFIAQLTVDSETMQRAKQRAKQSGASVNDLAVAAFVYALRQTPNFIKNGMIDVICTVDLRRYLKNPDKLGYTNLSTPFTCFVESRDKSFEETLCDVSRENNKAKADEFLGLRGLPLLTLGWTSMVYIQAAAVVTLLYRNPRLCLSNVGVIKPEEFVLDGSTPTGIFVAGPAKDKPYFLINVMSLNGEMLISSTVKGTAQDKTDIEAFFNQMKLCLTEYAGK